ncbi:hypothetical protein FH972_022107 [Carpinus fangiana]|uniref:Uncharacterized protein n=1 Tax=Carpinus fangiana TaxID=176857 RepID=A0A5N6KR98_9ROSI|nr:hypothetical protein FH972_022107 [Carpinus fangiana]
MLRPAVRFQTQQCSSLLRRTYATAATKLHENISSKQNAASPSAATVSTPDATFRNIQPASRRAAAGAAIMRTYKPRTPGVRHLKRPINDHLWKGRPFMKLTFPKKGQGRGGRNRTGRVTVRHRGGGHKRRIRIVDFNRTEPGKHVVERIEHDPNRTAHIALITNVQTQTKSYIIAAEGMREGDHVESFRSGIPQELLKSMGGVLDPGMLAAKTAFRGNCLPIRMVPLGSQVYNIGSTTGKGAVFCRSAGTYGIVISKEETRKKCKEVVVKLQSGEIRKVSPDACATMGVASNPHYHFTQLGKAGRKRWLGIRPTVRGLAMNAVDHPHGGGRGKSKGNRIPCSPWGQQAKSGFKTRSKRHPNKFVVTERERNHGKRRSRA